MNDSLIWNLEGPSASHSLGAGLGFRSDTKSSLLLSLLLLCGCADLANRPARHPATTSAPSDFRISDAIPFESLQSDGIELTFTDKLESPYVTGLTYFGEADQFDSDEDKVPAESMPLIAVQSDLQWKALPLNDPSMHNAGWKFVGAGPGEREVWGVLDNVTNDPSTDVVIVHSVDGAATFSAKVIRKPNRLAEYAGFAMGHSGQGRVTLSLETNCGRNKAGYYHYETNDDGRTWSRAPRYEPDSMIHADSVSDDEQPDSFERPRRILIAAHPYSAEKR